MILMLIVAAEHRIWIQKIDESAFGTISEAHTDAVCRHEKAHTHTETD